ARDPLRRGAMRVHAAPHLASELDRALLGMVDAVDDVEHRALAGAVRTDDRPDLVLAYVQADAGERPDAAGGKRNALELENDVPDALGRRGHRDRPAMFSVHRLHSC